jgi:hypothetical protein
MRARGGGPGPVLYLRAGPSRLTLREAMKIVARDVTSAGISAFLGALAAAAGYDPVAVASVIAVERR